MKNSVLAALALALLSSSAAFAADPFDKRGGGSKDVAVAAADKPWQGPYVAIGGGYRWHNWDSLKQAICTTSMSGPDIVQDWTGTEEECEDQSGHQDYDVVEAAHDEDADSWIATGRLGHDWQSDRVVFGVFGEANWLDASTAHFTDTEFLYGGGARLGYLLNDRLLAYINAGIELTDYSGLDTKVDPFLGGGLELLLADGWSVAGEGRYTFADDGELPASASNNDPITVRALLVKKF